MNGVSSLRATGSALLLSMGLAAAVDAPIQPWKHRSAPALTELSWLGDRWVAVSSQSKIFISADGVSWQSCFTGVTAGTPVARLGDSFFMAPGATARLAISKNAGANWFLKDHPAGVALDVIAGNGSLVVGVDDSIDGPKVTTTTDGVTWTPPVIVNGLSNTVLKWTGDRFANVGQGKIGISADGLTWTTTTWGGNWLNDVTGQPGGPLLAVGQQGQIAKSTDGGVTWTSHIASNVGNIEDVAGVSGSYVAINENGWLYRSADGLAWTLVPASYPFDLRFFDVGWNGSYFLAVGNGGAVWKSTDGITWQDHSIGGGKTLEDVVVGPPGIVTVGEDSILFSSDGGVNWKRAAPRDGVKWRGVAWCGDRFVAVGGPGKVGSSTDGLTWTFVTVPGANSGYDFNKVSWNGSRAVVTGEKGAVYTSENLVDWTRRTNGIPSNWIGWPVAWTGSQFVAMSGGSGSSHPVLRSADGIDWTAVAGSSVQAYAIACGGGRIVALKSNSCATSVDDGQTWAVSTTSISGFFPDEVIWDGNRFIAGGSSSVRTSPDGLVWTSAQQNTTYGLHGLAVTAYGYVGVSDFGNIWTSGSDDRPVATISSVSVSEASGPASLTVALSHATGEDLAIDYATVQGTAKEGSDYQPVSGTVVVPAGQTQAAISVPLVNDDLYEQTDTLSLEISDVSGGKGAYFDAVSPKVSITNDDPARIYVDDLTVNEADGVASVKIRCADPRAVSISIGATAYSDTFSNRASDSSTTFPADYVGRTATLILPKDKNEIFFDVVLLDDYALEREDETFQVAINSPTAVDYKAIVTILDGGPGYDGWARTQPGYSSSQFSNFLPTADRDKDGNENLASFAMGVPVNRPLAVAAAAWRPSLRPPMATGDRMFLNTSVPDPLPVGVYWEVQQSTDGQIWTSIASATPSKPWAGINAGIPVVIGEPVDGRRVISVGSSFTGSESPRGMMRMKWALLTP